MLKFLVVKNKGGTNDMKKKNDKSWNPYITGGISGIISILSVFIADKYLGASTTFVRASGFIEKLFFPERVAQMPYFIETAPKIDWQWMFIMGIFFGSLISALIFKDFQWKAIPSMWEKNFGKNIVRRAFFAFIGGVIAMFGARLADG